MGELARRFGDYRLIAREFQQKSLSRSLCVRVMQSRVLTLAALKIIRYSCCSSRAHRESRFVFYLIETPCRYIARAPFLHQIFKFFFSMYVRYVRTSLLSERCAILTHFYGIHSGRDIQFSGRSPSFLRRSRKNKGGRQLVLFLRRRARSLRFSTCFALSLPLSIPRPLARSLAPGRVKAERRNEWSGNYSLCANLGEWSGLESVGRGRAEGGGGKRVASEIRYDFISASRLRCAPRASGVVHFLPPSTSWEYSARELSSRPFSVSKGIVGLLAGAFRRRHTSIVSRSRCVVRACVNAKCNIL